jgi:hypothetical protein
LPSRIIFKNVSKRFIDALVSVGIRFVLDFDFDVFFEIIVQNLCRFDDFQNLLQRKIGIGRSEIDQHRIYFVVQIIVTAVFNEPVGNLNYQIGQNIPDVEIGIFESLRRNFYPDIFRCFHFSILPFHFRLNHTKQDFFRAMSDMQQTKPKVSKQNKNRSSDE